VASPVNNIGLSGGCEEKAWFGWPCDERLEQLRDDWARATDAGEQKRIAEALQRVAYDNVPYVNYGQWFMPTVYSKSLQGVVVSPVPFFWNIVKGEQR
jgi:peptide/nickel transport system substrate-binding protein